MTIINFDFCESPPMLVSFVQGSTKMREFERVGSGEVREENAFRARNRSRSDYSYIIYRKQKIRKKERET